MRANHVRQRLAAGEPSIGTWLALPSPEAAEFISQLGFDWLVIDTEHNAIDIRTLSQMFGVIAAAGVAPMVRIPWNNAENIKRVLDAGAWGLVVPMVNSREEAEAVVEATYFPPRGNRSVGGGMTGLRFGTSGGDYLKHADDEICVVIQIEHIKGVEAADEILSVPGIHACFIGPNDLAASMGVGLGVPLEGDHPRMIEAIEHIRTTCVKHGVAPGIHTSGAKGINQRLDEGFKFLAMASELKYLLGGLSDDLAAMNWTASARGQVGVAAAGSAVRY